MICMYTNVYSTSIVFDMIYKKFSYLLNFKDFIYDTQNVIFTTFDTSMI